MAYDTTKLRNRLNRIWQEPDFVSFFETYSKRPAIHVKAGNTFFYEGDEPDRLYFIKKGYVKLHHLSEEGKDTIIYLYGPGTILGVRALTSEDKALKHNAQAITDVTVISLARKDYLDIIEQHPEYLIDLLHVFIDRLNHTERKLEGFIMTDSTARVADFLAECAHRFGVKKDGMIALPIPLTHQRIAEFVGAFRETVTLAIRRLEKEGAISVKRGEIIIQNLAKLKRVAGSRNKT